MNQRFSCNNRQAGNVLIYVLIGIALFAALSITFSETSSVSSGQQSVAEGAQVILRAHKVIDTLNAARGTVETMVVSGSQTTDISALREGESGYTTAPHYHKLFHPLGGDFMLPTTADSDIFDLSVSSPSAGWKVSDETHVQWTPSSANDIVISAYGIKQEICAAVNERLSGSSTIPALGSATPTLAQLLAEEATAADFAAAQCASCAEYIMFCVSDSAANIYAVYGIIVGR